MSLNKNMFHCIYRDLKMLAKQLFDSEKWAEYLESKMVSKRCASGPELSCHGNEEEGWALQ